jgi:hypothetical protein
MFTLSDIVKEARFKTKKGVYFLNCYDKDLFPEFFKIVNTVKLG